MISRIHIYPVTSRPLGISYDEWSIKWWQWLCSIPIERNPAFDDTGELVYVNQNNAQVVFLCQTIEGTKNIPFRISHFPESGLFFMPIINWISIMKCDGNNDEQLKEIAKCRMDAIGTLQIEINGKTFDKGLHKFRVLSSFFDIELPKNNIFGLDEGLRRCISDGYWLFIHIDSDNLELSSYSSCSSGITQIKVKYLLN